VAVPAEKVLPQKVELDYRLATLHSVLDPRAHEERPFATEPAWSQENWHNLLDVQPASMGTVLPDHGDRAGVGRVAGYLSAEDVRQARDFKGLRRSDLVARLVLKRELLWRP
jgi:hypothetical protein